MQGVWKPFLVTWEGLVIYFALWDCHAPFFNSPWIWFRTAETEQPTHPGFIFLVMLLNTCQLIIIICGDLGKAVRVEGRTWSGLCLYSNIIFLKQHLYHIKCWNRLRNWTQTCHHFAHEAWDSAFFTSPSSIMNPLGSDSHLEDTEEMKCEENFSLCWRWVNISDPCLSFKSSQHQLRWKRWIPLCFLPIGTCHICFFCFQCQ